MAQPDDTMVRCAWCRKLRPAKAATCPNCGRVGTTEELRPLGGPGDGPAPPTPDDQAPGSDDLTPLGGPRPAAPPADGSEDQARPNLQDRLEQAPYRVERHEPAPGQEHPLTFAYVKRVAGEDPMFAVVLALMAFELLMSFVMMNILGVIIGAAIFWGVLSLQWWGYLIAIFGAVLGLLTSLGGFGMAMSSAVSSGTLSLAHFLFAAFSVVVNAFVLYVLYTRRSYFA
jgi:hypothetical protein